MVEFYYWREGSGGKSRLECVVLFLPDVWSAQPSRIEWSNIQEQYKATCEAALNKLDSDAQATGASGDAPAGAASEPVAESAPNTEPAAEKSQIVCSQYCLVMFPAACATM